MFCYVIVCKNRLLGPLTNGVEAILSDRIVSEPSGPKPAAARFDRHMATAVIVTHPTKVILPRLSMSTLYDLSNKLK